MGSSARLRVAMTVEQLWQPVPGGSGTYIRELLTEYSGMDDLEVTGIRAPHRTRPGTDLPPALPQRVVPLPRQVLYPLWNRTRAPRAGRGQDVVHATTWAVPGRRVPLVVTVHDLAFVHDPQHFTPRGVAFFRRGLEITREEAAAVIVPSLATRADCLEAGIEESRLHVVPHGIRRPTTTAEQVSDFRGRHGLDRPYVLWAGTREPRKNLPTLVEAFGLLRSQGLDLDLVLVGPDGWGSEQERLNGPDRAHVHLLGQLSRTELDAAYAGAHVFCYPSLREGFGLPVSEAMAHGTPVVTSSGTATEEVAGGAALLVDPRDPTDLAAALARACGEQEQITLRRAASRRAAELTWRATATRTLDVLRVAVG